MKRSLLFAMLLPLLLLAGTRAGRAQESGILLGLRYLEPIPKPLPYYAGGADSLARVVYRTMLVTRSGETFAVLPAAEALLIPRNNRFWRVGTKRSLYNNWVEDFVWAASEGMRPTYAGIQPFNGEYCEGHRAQTILYAGPRYVSLDQRSAGYCEGGAHPWFFNTLAVVPIDSTDHTGVAIDEVWGPPAYDALADAVEAFLKEIKDEQQRAAYIPEPDPANWGLVRRQGRWEVIGRMERAEAASQGLYTDLPLAFDVPPTFAGPTPQPATWRRIKAFAPDAVDAVVAPEGNWCVLLRPARLSIHPIKAGAVGPAALTQPLPPGTRVVMTHWATGARLRGWMQRVEQLARSN